jgi:putative inorganic carbon (hco3(-)) transporter
MSGAPSAGPALGAPRRLAANAYWVGLAGVLAVALGAVTGADVKIALVLAGGLALAVLAVSRPSALLPVLAAGLFLQAVAVGGATFERLIAPLALLVGAIELVRRTATIRVAPPLLWATAYSLWALASGLWTVSVAGTMFSLASLAIALTYMIAFAALLNTERELRRILYVLVVTALLVGASSVLAYAGRNPILSSAQLQEGRAQGGVGDPEAFSAFQVLFLPVLLVLIAETRKRWLRGVLVLAVLVSVASVITSVSRTGFVTLAALLPLLAFLPARALFRSRQQKTLLLLVIAIGVVGILSRPYPRSQAWNRTQAIWSPQKSGASRGSGRQDMWIVAKNEVAAHPLTGLGFGTFRYVSQDILVRTPGVDLSFYRPRVPGNYLLAHSAYFGSAGELGLPGLVLFLGMLLSTGLALRRVAVRSRQVGAFFLSRVANAFVLGLVAWAISAAFIETETARPFWILLGISLALPKVLESTLARGEESSAGGRIS